MIWTLCGGHIIDIYDGCIDEGIKIIDVRHEQVAAHAADGYSRQSGKIGCVVTTAGPGTTNAMTGIANAFRAESPLLMIGGQGALSQHKMGSLQDLPHVDFMSPITKFAASVPHTERIADMVSMAFRESRQWRAGTELFGNSARRARCQGAAGAGAYSETRRLPRIDKIGRRSRRHRTARRYSS